jgi:hypothetical protein
LRLRIEETIESCQRLRVFFVVVDDAGHSRLQEKRPESVCDILTTGSKMWQAPRQPARLTMAERDAGKSTSGASVR